MIYLVIVTGWRRVLVASLMGLVLLVAAGACASEASKGPPAPSADHVRSHADRVFETLKQEELERSAQPVPR